jgi:hypothetical protein
VLSWDDFSLVRDDAEERQLHGRCYWVYVVELDLVAVDGRPVLYVGQTSLTPEARLAQHQSGYKASRWVRQHGVRLRRDLYRRQPILRTHIEALTWERFQADALRVAGWTVEGGH